MRYGSVCSGIEAASVAWRPLGWECAFVSEIEEFPRAVLEHRLGAGSPNGLPLHGDFTTIKDGEYGAIDLLVGGTPCQSFSVAGGRKGLDDARGNLTLEFIELARRLGPRWVVWENVPGVLSLDEGRVFGNILSRFTGHGDECWFEPPEGRGWGNAGVVEPAGDSGYGCAWRVLDAQYVRVDGLERAVPQRRRRVFIVGCVGDWRSAGAVLFEREGLRGGPAPRRDAGEGSSADIAPSLRANGPGVRGIGDATGQDPVVAEVAPALISHKTGGGMGTDHDLDGGLIAKHIEEVAPTLNAEAMGMSRPSGFHMEKWIMAYETRPVAAQEGAVRDDMEEKGKEPSYALSGRSIRETIDKKHGWGLTQEYSPAVTAHEPHAAAYAIQEGAGRGNPDAGPDGVGVRDDGASYTLEARRPQAVAVPEVANTLTERMHKGINTTLDEGQTPLVFKAGQRAGGLGESTEVSPTLQSADSGTSQVPAVAFEPRHYERGEGAAAGDDFVRPLRADPAAGHRNAVAYKEAKYVVRRLMPVECERLQGFPDHFTRIPWKGRPAEQCPDTPRYRAIGNSMAVNVMRWIGRRIEMLEGAA